MHFASFCWLWFCYLLRMQIYLIYMIILYCFHYVVIIIVVVIVVVDYFVMQFLCCGFFGLSIVCAHCSLHINLGYSGAMLNAQCSWSLLFTIAICSLFILSSVLFSLQMVYLLICLFVRFIFFAFFCCHFWILRYIRSVVFIFLLVILHKLFMHA